MAASGEGTEPHKSPQKKARKPGAPRPDQMSPEVFEFLTAIDEYKRAHMRSFLAIEQVFEVLERLGYRPEGRSRADSESQDQLNEAIEEYKRSNERLFPSWSEIFQVVTENGWARQAG